MESSPKQSPTCSLNSDLSDTPETMSTAPSAMKYIESPKSPCQTMYRPEVNCSFFL